MGAVQNRGGDGGSGREFGFVRILARDEVLARGAGEDRQIERGELADLRQNLGVLFFPLAEAQARIDADRHLVDAGNLGAMHRGSEVVEDGSDHVLHRRQFRPGFGRSAHVVQDHGAAGIGDGLREQRVEGERARVVNDLDSERQRLGGDARLIGVDGNGNLKPALQALQHRNQAAELFGFGDPGRTRAGGFRADVDDVGALFLEFDGAGEGAVRVGVLAAVRKGVGSDIEHTHDERPVAQGDGPVRQFPVEALARHEFLQVSLCAKRW